MKTQHSTLSDPAQLASAPKIKDLLLRRGVVTATVNMEEAIRMGEACFNLFS